MSAYAVPPAAAGAHSPHTGFVHPGGGAHAQPATSASVYTANSAPFSSPFADPAKPAAFTHPQQYDTAPGVPQAYQQLSAYTTADVYAHPAAVGTAAAAPQQQKQQQAGSFPHAVPPNSAASAHGSSLHGSSVLTHQQQPQQQQPQQQQQQQQIAASEEEAMVCTQEIAHAFVYQYYLMLHENPRDIYRFYDQDSKMHRISDRASSDLDSGCASEPPCIRASGLQGITAAFEQLKFDRATCRIRNIEAQEIDNGGILVLVTGCLKHSKDAPGREFAQTVLLARMKPPRAGWYVHTEMFIYLDAMVGAAAEKAAAEARKEQEEEMQQRQRQLERQHQQQQQQQQQQELQREHFEQQQQQLNQQQQEQPQQQQQPTHADGALGVAPRAEVDSSSSEPVAEKEPAAAAPATPAAEAVQQISAAGESTDETPQGAIADGEKCQDVQVAEGQVPAAPKAAQPTRSRWQRHETLHTTEEASPQWPKPGQTPQKPPASEEQHSRGGKQQQQQQHNYDPQSFAYKVLQNVRPVAQRGFAIPAVPNAAADGSGEDRPNGRGSQGEHQQPTVPHQQQQQQQPPHRRLIILADVPATLSADELKGSINEALAAFNNGQCTDLRRPTGGRTFGIVFEVDSLQSAQYLVEHGLAINGRQARIDFVRPRGSGGPGRGGRGGLSQRGMGVEGRRSSGELRRGGRGGGPSGGAPFGGPSGERGGGEGDEEEAEGQWIDPAARRRQRAPRGGWGGGVGLGGGPVGSQRGKGSSSGYRGGQLRAAAQE